jgi:hypothetical protein
LGVKWTLLLVSFGVLVARIVETATSGPPEKGFSAKFGGPFRARSPALF